MALRVALGREYAVGVGPPLSLSSKGLATEDRRTLSQSSRGPATSAGPTRRFVSTGVEWVTSPFRHSSESRVRRPVPRGMDIPVHVLGSPRITGRPPSPGLPPSLKLWRTSRSPGETRAAWHGHSCPCLGISPNHGSASFARPSAVAEAMADKSGSRGDPCHFTLSTSIYVQSRNTSSGV
jgi:hypothetical protein